MIKEALNNKVENDRFLLFATLSRHFNSYFEITRKYLNFISEKTEEYIFTSPFVDFYKKSGQEKCKIAVWNVNENLFQKLSGQVAFTETFGKKPSKIYIPADFRDSYGTACKLLGKPDYELDGILVSSGRSIWVFDSDGPLGIKYDTTQLKDKKYFSIAHLSESGIWHSVAVTNRLRKEKNVFLEEAGLSLTFNENFGPNEPLKLTYLLRKPYEGFGLTSSDNLIPLHCFLSQRFWSQKNLLASLGIKKDFSEFVPELADKFAEFIVNAVTRTCIHFEAHQQNMTLVIGEGEIKKIIFQDLQDIFFDPISYFGILRPSNPEEFKAARNELFNFQWLLHFNAQGELIKHDELLREALTVSSFYRRFVTNQGHISESVAVLTGFEDILARNFESDILLRLKKSLPLNPNSLKDQDLLNQDLYWYIDRYIYENHQKIADHYFKMAEDTKAGQVPVEELMYLISKFNVIASANFPVHISKINKDLFGTVYNLYDNSVFLARYDDKAVIIMIFKYVNI